MQDEDVIAEFRASQALLEGHFLLSSGRHSAHYLQCARVLMDPMRASRLAAALVAKFPRELRKEIAKVVSPALGGVIIGHEMGRALGVEAMFVERPQGTFELRRGFSLNPGDKVVMVERAGRPHLAGPTGQQARHRIEDRPLVVDHQDLDAGKIGGRRGQCV